MILSLVWDQPFHLWSVVLVSMTISMLWANTTWAVDVLEKGSKPLACEADRWCWYIFYDESPDQRLQVWLWLNQICEGSKWYYLFMLHSRITGEGLIRGSYFAQNGIYVKIALLSRNTYETSPGRAWSNYLLPFYQWLRRSRLMYWLMLKSCIQEILLQYPHNVSHISVLSPPFSR